MKIFEIDLKAAKTPVNAFSFTGIVVNVSEEVKGIKMRRTTQNKGINL